MIITTDNINKKILLSSCCLADKAVDYIQAVNLGDIDKQECLMEKMQNLVFLRKALCGYLPYAEAGASYSGNIAPNTLLQDNITLTFFVSGVLIATIVVPNGVAQSYVFTYVADQFNAQQTQFMASWDGENPYYITISSTLLGDLGNGLVIAIYKDGVFRTNITMGDNGGYQPCLASTTDALAKKLIAAIDELCGCPCGCSKNIIDDNLPKYLN